jgi:hypothetical protein
MLVFGKVWDFGGLDAAIGDGRKRVNGGRIDQSGSSRPKPDLGHGLFVATNRSLEGP